MRILWVNPSFLDYRIPVYQRLFESCNGEFYIIFSRNRVPKRVSIKIKEVLGDNAICFSNEKRIILGEDQGMSNKWTSIPITHGLYKQIKKINADIIIAEGFFQWTPHAIRYSFFHKKPLLINYERTKHTERHCPKWRTLYRQLIDNFVSGYLCNGSLTIDYLKSIGVKNKKLFIGGMPADSKKLSTEVQKMSEDEKYLLRKKYNLNDKGLTYIYSGQLIERKGVIYLLKAWLEHIKTHINDHLLIVGGGPLYQTFTSKFNNEHSITFTGQIDSDYIYKYYAISDIFIIPTLEDNWSLVVPEAMSVGLPIACSIYNGCHPELVTKDNGITFDPLNKYSIIKALNFFHHINLSDLGKKSIEIEKQYNVEWATNNILNACQIINNGHTV